MLAFADAADVDAEELLEPDHQGIVIGHPRKIALLRNSDVLDNLVQNYFAFRHRLSFIFFQENGQNVNTFPTLCCRNLDLEYLNPSLQTQILIGSHLRILSVSAHCCQEVHHGVEMVFVQGGRAHVSQHINAFQLDLRSNSNKDDFVQF